MLYLLQKRAYAADRQYDCEVWHTLLACKTEEKCTYLLQMTSRISGGCCACC